MKTNNLVCRTSGRHDIYHLIMQRPRRKKHAQEVWPWPNNSGVIKTFLIKMANLKTVHIFHMKKFASITFSHSESGTIVNEKYLLL